MKTYTHPTIVLPAGSIVVKFYDDSKSGTETTLDIIVVKGIGDVEDGFDVNLGDLYLPSLELVLRNRSNYVMGTLLDTVTLRVSVTVDNEYYFFGSIDLNNISPDLLECSSSVAYGNITIKAAHIFSRLTKKTIADIDADLAAIIDPSNDFFYIRQFFRLIAQYCGLTFATFDDIDIHLARIYKYAIEVGYQEYNLDKVLLPKEYLNSTTPLTNYYIGRVNNAFELLTELAKDYFFYPSIIYDATHGFRLRIVEKDNPNMTISIPAVKKSSPSIKYCLNSLTTQLASVPDGTDLTNFQFKNQQTFQDLGDIVVNDLHYGNHGGTLTFQASMLIYLASPSYPYGPTLVEKITNVLSSSSVDYTNFLEAMHNAVKGIYFDNSKWREITTIGLKATDINSSQVSVKYLMPCSRFSFLSQNHYLHSVKKSIVRNESVLTCLRLS